MRLSNLVRVAICVAVAATSSLAASHADQPSSAAPRDAAAPGRDLVSPWNSGDNASSPGSGGGTLRVDDDRVASSPGSGGGTLKPLGGNGGWYADVHPMAR